MEKWKELLPLHFQFHSIFETVLWTFGLEVRWSSQNYSWWKLEKAWEEKTLCPVKGFMPDTALCTSQRLKFIYQHSSSSSGWGGSSVGKALDRHIADAGSIPQSGKGFFSQSRLSVQTLLQCLYAPLWNCMHLHLCARYRSRSPCQRSVNYGNTKTPSMYCRLGSATLSQLAFTREGNPNFPWDPIGTIVVKKKKVKKKS